MRKCGCCNQIKQESDFYKHKLYGLSYDCKCCHNKKSSEWYLKHPDKKKNKDVKYRINNKPNINKKRKVKRNTIMGKLSHNIEQGMRRSLKGKKGNHWEFLVGYTIKQLKQHIEKQFDSNMNWNNYGSYWQIDHIIPITAFNYERPEDIDFKKCWDLKNLQPLETIKNRVKNNKLIKPFQPSLAMGE